MGSIFDIIRHKNTRTPIAIAVYGDWGTGKSSAMRWLDRQLRDWSEKSRDRRGHPKVRTVWFDGWKYHDRVSVWRGLISEVILSTVQIKGASLATVTHAARRFGLFLGRGFLTALAAVKLKVGAEVKDKHITGSSLNVEGEIDLKALKDIADDWQRSAHPEKAFLNEFESTLKEWVQSALGDDERMVVFIDDLDRCMPDVAMEILEALKLYLNIPQLVFVVGLDCTVLRGVVREHYKKIGVGAEKADQYLSKMFQVEVEIPPTETQITSYVPMQIEALNEVSERYWSRHLEGPNASYREILESTIKRLADNNPREIKRLLNSTLLSGSAAARDESLGGDAGLRFAQGCQVYLIQKVLAKFVPESDRLLLKSGTWDFLNAWSDWIRQSELRRTVGPGGHLPPDPAVGDATRGWSRAPLHEERP